MITCAGCDQELTLKDNYSGANCVMTARYDASMQMMGMMNFPQSIDPCPAHNVVIKGKTYTLTARYDNSQPLTDVMGIALVYIWPGTQ